MLVKPLVFEERTEGGSPLYWNTFYDVVQFDDHWWIRTAYVMENSALEGRLSTAQEAMDACQAHWDAFIQAQCGFKLENFSSSDLYMFQLWLEQIQIFLLSRPDGPMEDRLTELSNHLLGIQLPS